MTEPSDDISPRAVFALCGIALAAVLGMLIGLVVNQ